MMYKMHWDAILDYGNGYVESRAGIYYINESSEEKAIEKAEHFLNNSNFVVWDAFLENDNSFIDLGY